MSVVNRYGKTDRLGPLTNAGHNGWGWWHVREGMTWETSRCLTPSSPGCRRKILRSLQIVLANKAS